jgi:peptidoglycan/xylan/chitin deacetylase (PgdA/CDA1 family)
MTQLSLSHKTADSKSSGRYFELLAKALPGGKTRSGTKAVREFWPDGAKLVISISLALDAAGKNDTTLMQSDHSAEMTARKTSDYGIGEGLPRLLEIFERRRVKVTSHITSAAADQHPQLAREIVQRGHEAAALAQASIPLSTLSSRDGRLACQSLIQQIVQATGRRPVGLQTFAGIDPDLGTLQDLGFFYHADDISHDEPVVFPVGEKSFAAIPYSMDLDDLVLCQQRHFSSEAYASELRNEFEMLYSEADHKRRMMSVGIHCHIAGRPGRARLLEEFILYAQRRPGVVFMRKDEIAQYLLSSVKPGHQRQELLAAEVA